MVAETKCVHYVRAGSLWSVLQALKQAVDMIDEMG